MSRTGVLAMVVALALLACDGPNEVDEPAIQQSPQSQKAQLVPRLGAPIRFDAEGAFDVTSSRGTVWVVAHSGREAFSSKLVSVDPDTGDIGRSIPLGTNAWNAIAVGRHVWVTDDDGLKKVSPRQGVVRATSEASAGIEMAATPGAIWTSDGLRFDASTGRMQTKVEGLRGNEITSSESSVWVSNSNRSVIYELDARENSLVSDIDRTGYYADQLVYGEGALWVAWETDRAEISVTRVDVASGEISEGASIFGKNQLIATDMTVAQGYVWLLAYGSQYSRLYQFDAQTGERVGRFLQLEGTALWITATDGTLWVGDLDRSVLTRIDLEECTGADCSS